MSIVYKEQTHHSIGLPVIRRGESYKELLPDHFDVRAFVDNYLPKNWNFANKMEDVRLPGWAWNGQYYYSTNIEVDLQAIRERDDVFVDCSVAISLTILYLCMYIGYRLEGKFIADNKIYVNDYLRSNLRAISPRASRIRLKYTFGCRYFILGKFLPDNYFIRNNIPTSYQGENSLCIDGQEIAYFRQAFGSVKANFILTTEQHISTLLKRNGRRLWAEFDDDTRRYLTEECKHLLVNGVRGGRPESLAGRWIDMGIVYLL